MNTRLLGIFCIICGLTYLAGGVWLAIAGAPTDPRGVHIAHLFSLIWAGGGLCGLLGMFVTNATGTGRIAKATLSIPAIGLILVIIDAVIALITPNPLSPFSADSPSPLSTLSRLLLVIGFLILTIFVLKAKQWTGWSRFTPLAILLALFIGMLLGNLIGIGFFQLAVIGLSWALTGFAVQTQQANTLMP